MWNRDSEILSELITENAKVEAIIGNYDNKQVTLTESEQNDYSITFQSIPDTLFIIDSDQFPNPKSIFNNKKKECKRSDFILLVETSQGKCAIFLELKLSNDSNSEIIIAVFTRVRTLKPLPSKSFSRLICPSPAQTPL